MFSSLNVYTEKYLMKKGGGGKDDSGRIPWITGPMGNVNQAHVIRRVSKHNIVSEKRQVLKSHL